MDRKINYRRWLDIVWLGLVGYTIICLIAGISSIQEMFFSWINIYSSLHFSAQILLTVIGFYLALRLLQYFNVFHWKQLRNPCLFAYHPPIICSIILCFFILSFHLELVQFLSNTFLGNYLLVSGALIFVLVVGLYVWNLCGRTNNDVDVFDNEEIIDIPKWIQDENQKARYRWLLSEKPIKSVDADYFGREVYVERIVRLFDPVGDERKHKANHISIVGPFGIGKTSIWKCVKERLGDSYIFVPVDGWGRGKGTVAAQIIDEMVAALTNYVDCASIRNVPKEYMAALSGADFKGISTLAKILPLHSHQSPEELIRKIETILLSIGKTMVVVLEDFDRNPQEENIMNEVAGLLDRLRDLRSINFIVCLAPGMPAHILSRISTHREDLLSCNAVNVISSVLGLMESCFKDKCSNIPEFGHSKKDLFSEVINSVVTTPRDAKYFLRRSLGAWEKLAGEVDRYDLVAINALRYSVPDVFDYVIQNWTRMRGGSDLVPNLIDSEFPDLIELLKGRNEAEGILSVLRFIFPPESIGGMGIRQPITLQRICSHLGNEYLEIITEERPSEKGDLFLLRGFIEFSSVDVDELEENNFVKEVVASHRLRRRFLHFLTEPLFYQEKYISDYLFYSFLSYRYKSGQSILLEDVLDFSPMSERHLIAKYKDSRYASELISIVIEKDIRHAYVFCHRDLRCMDVFLAAFFDFYSARDWSVELFCQTLAQDDYSTLPNIYDHIVRLDVPWHDHFLGLLIDSASKHPEYVLGSLGNIVDEYAKQKLLNDSQYKSWQALFDSLKTLFESVMPAQVPDVVYNLNATRIALLKEMDALYRTSH